MRLYGAATRAEARGALSMRWETRAMPALKTPRGDSPPVQNFDTTRNSGAMARSLGLGRGGQRDSLQCRDTPVAQPSAHILNERRVVSARCVRQRPRPTLDTVYPCTSAFTRRSDSPSESEGVDEASRLPGKAGDRGQSGLDTDFSRVPHAQVVEGSKIRRLAKCVQSIPTRGHKCPNTLSVQKRLYFLQPRQPLCRLGLSPLCQTVRAVPARSDRRSSACPSPGSTQYLGAPRAVARGFRS